MRFRSRHLRFFVMVLSTFNSLIYLGISLYAPTIALSSLTPVSINTYIFLLGGVCTLYSTIVSILIKANLFLNTNNSKLN